MQWFDISTLFYRGSKLTSVQVSQLLKSLKSAYRASYYRVLVIQTFEELKLRLPYLKT